jgi:hypothetical protein
VHWRSISRDNILTLYGKDENSRIADPPTRRIFTWLICETRDDKGNAVLYEYKPEGRRRRRSLPRLTSATGATATTRAARPTAISSASATATARPCWTMRATARFSD